MAFKIEVLGQWTMKEDFFLVEHLRKEKTEMLDAFTYVCASFFLFCKSQEIQHQKGWKLKKGREKKYTAKLSF